MDPVRNYKNSTGFVKEIIMKKKTAEISNGVETKTQNLITRPPVVVVLGHIDHGKSSLLNAIQKLQFTGGKPGGVITQHIESYQIEKDGKKITFIDTPGHEAFSAMRSRGAKVADIAILVIDAAEGVKDQTKEAISHIKKIQIPLIVALNKIDKPEANPEKVKRELQKEDVLVESLGGKVPSVETSAKTGKGIDELLEVVLLIAEMEDLKADILGPAEGVVIESYLDKLRGPTATLILTQGVLRVGDVLGTNFAFGKIKNLENFQGLPLSEASPGDPIIVVGFEDCPRVGEKFRVFSILEEAKNYLIQSRTKTPKESPIGFPTEQRVLNLILKADFLGSTEAIEEVLKKIPQEKIILRVLKSEVGEINESDIKTAKSSKALILGFRVKINPFAKNLAEREKIKIMQFQVIYDLVEEVRKLCQRFLKAEVERIDIGRVKALVIFLIEKNRQIIGGKVIEGEVKKGALIEVFRGEELIDKGRLINLQKNKKDTERVSKGEECGILYEGETKIEEGDVLLIYTEERKREEI